MNSLGEKLDVSLDGVGIKRAKTILIYNHGFGTDRHERGLTDDMVKYLKPDINCIAFIRMSYSGYGASEGVQELKTLDTMADDLVSVWKYVDKSKPKDSKITTISFSMGNQIFTKAFNKFPIRLDKMICVSPMNFTNGIDGKKKWAARPGVTYSGDIMNVPRADGTLTKLSQSFWNSIDPVAYKSGLCFTAEKFNSYLIRATEDDVVDNTDILEVPFKHIAEISGDHNFSKKEDRAGFLKTLAEIIGQK